MEKTTVNLLIGDIQ